MPPCMRHLHYRVNVLAERQVSICRGWVGKYIIANDFAHQLEVNSFDRDDMRDRCRNLVLSQAKIVKAIRGDDGHSIVLVLGERKKEREEEIPFSDFSFETCPPS